MNRLTISGKIIVVSAASGAGKTTLLDRVRATFPDIVYSVSVTTRKPRSHEKNGVHYFFVGTDEFRGHIARNELAEWQEVHGNFYGTPRRFVEETVAAGRHIVMDIDVYGKKKLETVFPEAVGILILPPSMDILEKRLRDRRTESEEAIRTRLANARKEMEFARTEGTYEYTIVNDDLERAGAEMVSKVAEIIGR